MSHELKTQLKYFKAMWAGVKTFEVRNNDRDFHVHDEVVFQEYDQTKYEHEAYTGRKIEAFITYITDFKQKPGYVVFSFSESYRSEE